MKCSVCSEQGKDGYVKHQPCPHYVCIECVRVSVNLTGLHPAKHLCPECEPEVDYMRECPRCYVTYTEFHTRTEHNCLLDEGVFDL